MRCYLFGGVFENFAQALQSRAPRRVDKADIHNMGLFDGIKRNLNIGGLKVRGFTGPTVFRFSDPTASLSFTLVTKESAAHVNSMKLALLRERPQSSGSSTTTRTSAMRTLKITNEGAGWDVPAAAEVPFTFELPLDTSAQFEQQRLADSAQAANPNLSDEQGSQLGSFASKAASIIGQLSEAEGFLHPDDRWYFELTVDVADVMMDPGARIKTQLASFGQYKAATRFSL